MLLLVRELQFTVIAQITSYFLHASYKLLLIARITS